MHTQAKVAYVKAAGQVRRHHCHWPGCERQVPPAAWGCRGHWYSLPIDIRNAIWKAFRPGQEISGRPNEAYIAAARAAQNWIAANHPNTTGAPHAPQQQAPQAVPAQAGLF